MTTPTDLKKEPSYKKSKTPTVATIYPAAAILLGCNRLLSPAKPIINPIANSNPVKL